MCSFFEKWGGDGLSKDEANRYYNYIVGILFELFDRIIKVNKTDMNRYVYVGGEMLDSYIVWDYEFTENDRALGLSLNLLKKRQVVCVNRSGVHKKDIDTDIKKIDANSEMFYLQNDWLYCTVSDIYNYIYAHKNDFGITFEPDWPQEAADCYIHHI
jgi:hypothetical protein